MLTWRRPSQSRIAVRAGGTANAAATATTRTARAIATGLSQRRCRSRRPWIDDARSGVGGNSTCRPSSLNATSSSGIRLPQVVERTRRARLDGADANVEHRGGLLLRELEEVAAGDHEPLLLPQRVDGGEQLLTLLAGEQVTLGGRSRAPRGSFRGGGTHDQRRAPALGAAPVPRLVGDDLKQPRPKGRTGAKPAERAVGLDEPFLGRLLGLGRAPDDQICGAKCDPLMCTYELLIGAFVAAASPLDELAFVSWPAHHCP